MKYKLLRGNEVYKDINGEYRYKDSDMLTHLTWRSKACGKCGEFFTPEGHDPCLGTLSGVMNACCGHGTPEDAYIQYNDKSRIGGDDAINIFKELELYKKN